MAAGLLALALAASAAPEALVTINPVTVAAPGRPRPLQVRVTAPLEGRRLPVVVFSHGDGFSKDDYQPLTEYWAAQGFVVVQPTHLDSRAGGLPAGDPGRAANWRVRAQDLAAVIDALPAIEQSVPGLRGRVDRTRVIAAGHSFGGYTAGVLVGSRPMDPATGAQVDLADARVLGAVMLAAPGGGNQGADLSPAWRERGRYLNADYKGVTRPMLVVAGRLDQSAITVRDWTWQTDAYRLSPAGDKCLLVVSGVKHYLGGVLGLNRTEAGESAPEAVSLVQRSTLAFMRGLVGEAQAWPVERDRLAKAPAPVEEFECR
jgi:dienelactone hydrolase